MLNLEQVNIPLKKLWGYALCVWYGVCVCVCMCVYV